MNIPTNGLRCGPCLDKNHTDCEITHIGVCRAMCGCPCRYEPRNGSVVAVEYGDGSGGTVYTRDDNTPAPSEIHRWRQFAGFTPLWCTWGAIVNDLEDGDVLRRVL